MFGWLKKDKQEKIESVEETLEVQPFSRKDIEGEFYKEQNNQVSFALVKTLRGLAKSEEGFQARLQIANRALLSSAFSFIREAAIDESMSYLNVFFKKLERNPADEDKQKAFGFIVYQLSKDTQKLLAYQNEVDEKVSNPHLLAVADLYSSLITIWSMLGTPQPGLKLNRALTEVIPELEGVLPEFVDPSKKLEELIEQVSK